MKNLIKNLSNTQKKILAAVITITMPIWIFALPFLMLFGLMIVMYVEISDALGVKE